MSRQHVEYTTSVTPGDDLDTGEVEADAIVPVADGEPAQGAVFARPSENLRTRTEVIRTELENLKYLSDYDRALLLTSTGDITWNGLPTGTFASSANMVLKPFLAPTASTPATLTVNTDTDLVHTHTLTITTNQDGNPGQPRAYNGANQISFDFSAVDRNGVNPGDVVITVDGAPANNFHVEYDSNAGSGTTTTQLKNALNADASFLSAGLEADIAGGAGDVVDIPVGEQSMQFLAGATDAESHIVTPAHVTNFFADPLNVLEEGDVVAISYDDLVMQNDGGRRQSIGENPENKASVAGANLFLVRRFPERLPLALPLCTVVGGKLVFINNRSYVSGEVGALAPSGMTYQGSPAAPNSWADGTTVGAGTYEATIDTIVQTLGVKSGGSPGSIKVGFTPYGNIAANTVFAAIKELDDEKAGLALSNTFTGVNTITAAGNANALNLNGSGSGRALNVVGGNTNGNNALYVQAGTTNGNGIVTLATGTGAGLTAYSSTTAGATAAIWAIASGSGGFGVSSGPYNRDIATPANNVPANLTGMRSFGQGTGHGLEIYAGEGPGGADGQTGAGIVAYSGTDNTAARYGILAYNRAASATLGYGVRGESTGITNGNGVLGKAIGTGWGVKGEGGATSGAGVWGVGGSGGIGVKGEGTGAGPGVRGDGGSSNGWGVEAHGGAGGTGHGLVAYGGASAHGAFCIAGAGSGSGVVADGGTGTGAGLYATGGDNNGVGIYVVPSSTSNISIDCDAGRVYGMATPVGNTDATTKAYVDTADAIPNLVHNGNFNIWARGTDVVSTSKNSTGWSSTLRRADRWLAAMRVDAAGSAGNNTFEYEYENWSGGTHTTNVARLRLTAVRTLSSAGAVYVFQDIDRELLRAARGKKLTISFRWAKGSTFSDAGAVVVKTSDNASNGKNMTAYAATVSTILDTTTANGSIGTDLATGGVTVVTTSVVPTTAASLAVGIGFTFAYTSTVGADAYLDITDVIVKIGEYHTSSPLPDVFPLAGGTTAGEIEICQRFYEDSASLGDAGGVGATHVGAAGAGKVRAVAFTDGAFRYIAVPFKTRKRTDAGVLSLWDPISGNGGAGGAKKVRLLNGNAEKAAVGTDVAGTTTTEHDFMVDVADAAAGDGVSLQYAYDAEFTDS